MMVHSPEFPAVIFDRVSVRDLLFDALGPISAGLVVDARADVRLHPHRGADILTRQDTIDQVGVLAATG